MSGPKKSFQAHKKWKMLTVASAGQAWGIRTYSKIWNGLAPSIRAASSISIGTVMKNWRSRKTSQALAKKAGTIKGKKVSYQPIFLKSTNVGISVTWAGSMMVESSNRNKMLIYFARKREKP